MSISKNKVQLIGRIGATPVIKTTISGTKYCQIRLATSDLFKNKSGEWVEEVQWHTLVIWGALTATIEKSCDKGSQILVEGKIMYREYTDNDDVKRVVTEIKVDGILPFEVAHSKKKNAEATPADLPEDLPM